MIRTPYQTIPDQTITMTVRETDVCELVRSLMLQHGLHDWIFQQDNSIARAGCCNFGTRTISLSKHLVRDDKHSMHEVKNTALHEIAHALAGPRAAHGPEWKSIAIHIGCDGIRCHSMELKEPAKVMACRDCGYVNAIRHRVMRKFWNSRPCCRCGKVGSVMGLHRDAWDTVRVAYQTSQAYADSTALAPAPAPAPTAYTDSASASNTQMASTGLTGTTHIRTATV